MQLFAGFWLDIAAIAHRHVHAEATALLGPGRGCGTSTHQSVPMLSRNQPSTGCMWPLTERGLNLTGPIVLFLWSEVSAGESPVQEACQQFQELLYHLL